MSGRVYPGLASNWGASSRVGWVDLSLFLSRWRIPAVSRLLHSMGYAGDLMVRFDETRPAHYRLFGVTAVVAPATHELPSFLDGARAVGEWKLASAPGGGYFDVVDAPFVFVGNNTAARELCERWIVSPLVESRQHIRLALRESEDVPGRRLGAYEAMPPVAALESRAQGVVLEQSRQGETYRARVEMQSPGILLFKMGFHPDWTAVVNGRKLECVPLSPFLRGRGASEGTARRCPRISAWVAEAVPAPLGPAWSLLQLGARSA